MRRLIRPCFVAAAFTALLAPADVGHAAEGDEFFERRIRPLLVERCFECHSAEKKVKGGLRLDHREGWARGGDSGPAIVLGEPAKSLLVKAVHWADEDLQMPPKNKLTPAQIADLEHWVKLGAPDPRGTASGDSGATVSAPLARTNHWAYQPPRRTAPPTPKDAAWPRTDIDRFLLARMEEHGLRPAADADRATLARRVHFDLIGLPPTPEQIDAFVNDAAPGAFARLVDRLLASPQFGEHWARHWFDVARYAESVTLRGFIFKEAWRYRDYVIDAFNRDLPYDQFLREQLAGDLLPDDALAVRQRRLIATTFLALGNTNLEEQDKKQLDMDVVDEQIDVIGKALLGQTISCARCHDHKFDPIPTRDYYAIAGILRNARLLKHANVSEWLESPLPVEPAQEAALQKHEAAIAALQSQIKTAKEAAKALAGKSGEPKADGKSAPARASVVSSDKLSGLIVDSAKARPVGEWKHSTYSKHFIDDGYLHDLDQGKGSKTLSFAPEITRAGRYEVRFAYIHAPSRATNVPVTVFHADGETVISVNQHEAPVIDGRFVSLGQFRFEANGFANVLVGNEGTRGFVTADAVQFVPAETVESLAETRVSKPDSTGGPDIKSLEGELKRLQTTGPKRPRVMTVQEGEAVEDCPIHVRGSVNNLGPKVPRGFLSAAHRGATPRLPEKQSGRRELADWIASPDNPLTARVFVNRVWCWLSGEGLVRSVDNFGTTGDAPSHPELLDHLAVQFVSEGWSAKKLVREIVLSRAYQLSSVAVNTATDTAAQDVENRWFSRMNRRRLTAEQMRDAMLAVSGRLQLEPPQGPTFPQERAADFGFDFTEPRRSVYAPVFRNALPEIFEAFDFAPTALVTGRRNVSTVPTQALFLLNHPFVREQAQGAAKRLLAENLPEQTRLSRAYRLTLGREPSARERELAGQHLSSSVPPEEAWAELFHALFASADFRHLD